MDRIPSSKTIKALPNQLKQTKYYISFLISSVWLLLSTNQLDLKTWIEHNITSVPNPPQRRQKKKNRLFLLLHPSAARRFQSVPPPLSIKTSKSVSIYYQRGKKKKFTWKRMVSRASGAVHVLLTAPAKPPAARCAAVPMWRCSWRRATAARPPSTTTPTRASVCIPSG